MADGVLSAKDVDVVMSEGLGMRYAFLGAFEAAHLNAEGTRSNRRTQKKNTVKYYYEVSFSNRDAVHIDTPFAGLKKYCETYSKAIYDVSMTFGPTPKFAGEMAEKISNELNEICPLDKLQERRAWRDTALTKLCVLKKELEQLKK